jgi:uncharacterized glyoxalase superfamily protein PhnB
VADLENLRKRAKQIVREHRSGLVTLAPRLRQGLERFAGMTDHEVLDAAFSLHDAQQLLAIEHGFRTWAELVAAPVLREPAAPTRRGHWRAFPQVFVRDLRTSLVWYGDELGFTVDYTYGEPPFHARVSRESMALELRRTDRRPWAEAPDDDELLAVRIEVDDIKALFLELRDRGVALHQALRTEPWGQVTFLVADPDGNLLSFGSYMP